MNKQGIPISAQETAKEVIQRLQLQLSDVKETLYERIGVTSNFIGIPLNEIEQEPCPCREGIFGVLDQIEGDINEVGRYTEILTNINNRLI